MEEITIRFEIVRLAVKMADHETIQVQAKKLREISLDEDLNEIITLLENRNYRQGLYLMKGYISSLEDSFFNPPPVEPPKKQEKPKPKPEAQNLFDMMQSQTTKTINLDDMMRMTEESASRTIAQGGATSISESYIEHVKEEVQKNEAYLDVDKNRVENKTILSPVQEPKKALQQEELYNPLNDRVETLSSAEREDSIPEQKTQEELLSAVENQEVIPSEPEVEAEQESKPESEVKAEQESKPEPEVRVEVESGQEEQAKDTKEAVEEAPVAEEEKSTEETIPSESSESNNQETEEKTEEISIDTEEPLSEIAIEEEEQLDQNTDKEALESSPEETAAIDSSEEPSSPEKSETKEILSAEEAQVKEIDIALDIPKPSESSKVHKIEDPSESEVTSEVKDKSDYTKENKRYPPISYIDQKFRNMRHQFPQVEPITEISSDVKMLLKLMATKGYTENDIRETIAEFQKKKSAGELSEAAQLLLIAAASESKYAQLLLARELFKGEVLVADYPESFTQINRLAEHDYPEAICDLAQLYEYGYGIKKDKKTALLLYQEAAEMGVSRAQKHVERLSGKKGLLGALFKR